MARQVMSDAAVGWNLSASERQALRSGLLVLKQVQETLHAWQARRPDFSAWATKYGQEAADIKESFAFFLDAPVIPSCYRFAAWVGMPEALQCEVARVMRLFNGIVV